MCYAPSYGALTQLWAGTSDEGRRLGGRYLGPWAREVEPLAITQVGSFAGRCRNAPGTTLTPCLLTHPLYGLVQDEDLAQRMWEWCEKECEGF
jgi:hypothetical protein